PPTNKVYVFGGWDGVQAYTTTRVYDIATNSWTTGPPMPGPRQQMASGYSPGNQRIYLAGGFSTGNIDPAPKNLWEFNPAPGTFTEKAPMPAGLGGPGFGIMGGHFYVAGGRNLSGGVLSSTYDYNIATDSWATVANMPQPTNVPGSGVANGRVYTFGQGNPFSPGGGLSAMAAAVPDTAAVTFSYAPNAWNPNEPLLNGPPSFVGGTNIGNTLVAVGGYTGAGTTAQTETLTGGGHPPPPRR